MRGIVRVAAIVALIVVASPAHARRRLIRSIDARMGLNPETVSSLAQDGQGFIWLGTVGGLFRWDGLEMRRVAAATLASHVVAIRPTADGGVYVVDIGGNLLAVDHDRAVPVRGPDQRPLTDVDDVWLARDGALWVAAAGGVRERDPHGAWQPAIAGIARARRLRDAPDGTLLVASNTTVWRVEGTTAVELAHGEHIHDILPARDGTLWLGERDGRVVRVDGAGQTEVLSVAPDRPVAFAARGDQVWIATSSELVVLRPGEPAEHIGRTDGLPSGGPLLVDADGSLWIATYQGALQLPEPDTAIYTEADGLPSGMRYVTANDDGIWATTWTGLGHVGADGRAETAWRPVGQACVDTKGRLWTSDGDSFLLRVDGRFATFPHPHGYAEGCAPGSDGRVWMLAADHLYRTPLEPGPPEPFALPPDMTSPEMVHEDHRGRLWASSRERICATSVIAPAWRCDRIAGAYEITDIEDTERGTIWAATEQTGVARYDEQAAHWQVIPGSLELPSRHVSALAPSPRGGTWVVGSGFVRRVIDRPERSAGWELVETLDMWHGLAAADAQDVVERADGTVWLAGFGLHRIPPEVRARTPAPPRVLLTRARVSGDDVATTEPIELPYDDNRLELWFAAMSFRDPGRVRYRVRVRSDAPWSEPTSQPSFRFAELAPGTYRAEVAATLDGTTWSVTPATLLFRVRAPWWRRPWVIALGIAALALLLWLAHRMRIAMQLRLERQRARIAMDLHDDMGSTLGSIGILASLAADETVPACERSLAAAQIAETAEELGESLGDIVWSLRLSSSTLDAVIAHVVERGARLFADERTELRTELPAPIPALPLSLAVSRNLQLIAIEALHNAARHANARAVVLGLARVDRRRWRLWIEDDGTGLPASVHASAEGLGLTSMQRRASDIAADLEITGSSGTRIAVTFALDAVDRRLVRSRGKMRP